IAQQIRQPKRHQEGVEVFTGAEKSGKNLFANQSKQARAHNRHANDAGRAGAYSLRFSHRRTKNNVSDFTKAKTSIRGGRCDFRRKGRRSKLLDLAAALAEQSQKTARTAHVRCSDDNKVDLPAAKIVFNLRDPIAIPRVEQPFCHKWKIAKRFARFARKQVRITTSPRVKYVDRLALCAAGIDKQG